MPYRQRRIIAPGMTAANIFDSGTIMKKHVWTVIPAFLFLAVLMIPMSGITIIYNPVVGFIELGVTMIVITPATLALSIRW